MYRQSPKQQQQKKRPLFVGSYYSEDFHVPANVINPCKRNSYYICGKLPITFVVGSGSYVCGKCIAFNAADLCYVCGLIKFAGIIILAGVAGQR